MRERGEKKRRSRYLVISAWDLESFVIQADGSYFCFANKFCNDLACVYPSLQTIFISFRVKVIELETESEEWSRRDEELCDFT